MKIQIIYLIAAGSIGLLSCSTESGSNEPETFDDKVKAVCDCFEKKVETGEAPKECFMLQGKYEKTVNNERRVEFIQKTNDCAN